jgi:hypothetical protein
MRGRLGIVALGVALTACGGGTQATRTVVVTKPPDLGPPTQEAAAQPLARKASFTPDHGVARKVTFRSGGGCGKERWAVKTLTDPLAGQVDLTPKDTTIAKLVAIAPPVDPTDRVAPTEETTYRVQGVITFVKKEADSDYHVVVEDPQGNTMIVEATSPNCDQGSLVASQIQQVRQAMDAQFPTAQFTGRLPATVTGVGFFDRLHGQTGVAPNGIELHPLTAVELGPAAGVPAAARTVPSVPLKASPSSD